MDVGLSYIVAQTFNFQKPYVQTQTKSFWLEMFERLRIIALMVERLQKPEDVPSVVIQTEDVVVESQLNMPLEILTRIVYVQRYGHPCPDEGFDKELLHAIETEVSLMLGSPNLVDQSAGIAFKDADTVFEPGPVTKIIDYDL